MGRRKLLLMTLFLVAANTAGAAQCEKGWTAYKDELCVRVYSKLQSYDDAKDFCAAQNASLVTIKDSNYQSFIAEQTRDVYDNLWLGGKLQNTTAEWEDGEALNYTNWNEGYPMNRTENIVFTCLELIPSNDLLFVSSGGKWSDTVCKKRNLVMCQKPLIWTFQDAVGEIVKIRKQFETVSAELETTKHNLKTTQQKLQSAEQKIQKNSENLKTTQQKLQTSEQNLAKVTNRVVPVGSIYIEYSGQSSPRTLWPDLRWEDVTSRYAGLFFRASGGGAAGWGSTQDECAPRITHAHYDWGKKDQFTPHTTIPSSGWSPHVKTGTYGREDGWEGVKFHTQHCSIRPKNQAIRIWKRSA